MELHDVQLQQQSLRVEHRYRLTYLVRLGRLWLWVSGGFWLVVHACREYRFGLWDEHWLRLELQNGHWGRLTHLGRLNRL